MRVLLLLLALAAPAQAGRSPTVGGEVRIEADEATRAAIVAAAGRSALLQLLPTDAPAWLRRSWAPLAGTDLRSGRVTSLEASDGGRAWRIVGRDLADPLSACMLGRDAWPGAALHAAGVTVSVAERGDGALLRFSAPVGAVPELLTGCSAPSQRGFREDDGDLVRPMGPGLRRLRFVAPGEPADLRLEPTAAPGRDLVVSDVEGVALLLQDDTTRGADPLGIGEGALGLAGFRDRLRPGLMAQVLADGRAEAASGILPPALVPVRPPPPSPAGGRSSPGGGEILLQTGDDPLLVGLADRLIALVDARGGRGSRSDAGGARLLRWAPRSRDPALALLALGDASPELGGDGLRDPRLLAGDRDTRLSAALDLERRWIDERRAVPLLSARRWIAVPRELHGVRLGADGVLRLDSAWWAAP